MNGGHDPVRTEASGQKQQRPDERNNEDVEKRRRERDPLEWMIRREVKDQNAQHGKLAECQEKLKTLIETEMRRHRHGGCFWSLDEAARAL